MSSVQTKDTLLDIIDKSASKSVCSSFTTQKPKLNMFRSRKLWLYITYRFSIEIVPSSCFFELEVSIWYVT